MKIRTVLKVCITSAIIGFSGWGFGQCTNGCTYQARNTSLNTPLIGKPSCDDARKRLEDLKKDDTFQLWKYWRGDYGHIKAYEEYIKNQCK